MQKEKKKLGIFYQPNKIPREKKKNRKGGKCTKEARETRLTGKWHLRMKGIFDEF